MTTLYRHDGQMGMEDVEVPASGTPTVTRYALGARGVDMIERTNSSGTVTAFPVYDAHGNDVASLTRSGTGFSIGDRRTYDAWGVVRAQQSGGDPKLRYCANLGHKADDESGLVYMRARYYEPSSGRFVSEDPGMHGGNWFIYANNEPVLHTDSTGKFVDIMAGLIIQWAEQVEDAFKLQAKKWADNKAETIASEYAGRIAGWIVAMDMDDFDCAGWGTDGFIIEHLNDMSPTGRRVVVNLNDGQIDFMEGDKSMAAAFFKGFLASFGDAMGIG